MLGPNDAGKSKPLLVYHIPCLVAADFLLYFLVAARPSLHWRIFGFSLFAFTNLYATQFTMGHVMLDYSIGSAFAHNVFTAYHFLWLSDPDTILCHEQNIKHPSALSLWERVYLVVCLRGSARGIGWKGQVKNIPPPQNETRWKFVYLKCLEVVKSLFILDASLNYLYINPLFSMPRNGARSVDQGWLLHCVNIIMWIGAPCTMINLGYSMAGVILVGFGISKPKYWPDFFGSWRDAYTVRNFWGKAWHQQLRRCNSSMGKSCAQFLGFTSGCLGSSFIQLYAAFILSALMHCTGDIMVGGFYTGSSFMFFFVQAHAIVLETVVIAIAKNFGLAAMLPNVWARRAGYIWVILWLMFAVTRWYFWQVDERLFVPFLLPVSPVRWILDCIERMGDVDLKALFPS